MSKPSDDADAQAALRLEIMGFGERAGRKSHFPELRGKLRQLERFRTLLDRSHDAILLVEVPSGCVVDFNASTRRLTGLRRNVLEQMTLPAIIGESAWLRLNELLSDGQSDPGIRREIQIEMKGLHGAIQIVELSIGFHGFADGLYAVVVMHDITEREKAFRDLRSTHRQFSDVIDFLPDPTFVIDDKSRVVAWNRAMEQLTGIDKPAMLGKGQLEVAHAIHGRRFDMLIDSVLRGEGVDGDADYDHVEKRGDTWVGEVFAAALHHGRGAHVWVAASPLRDAEGHIVGAIESIRDRTERRAAAEALRASEQDLRITLNSITDGVITTDGEGLVRKMNPAAVQMTGLSAEAAAGRPLSGVLTLLDLSTRERIPRPDLHVLQHSADRQFAEDMLLRSTDGGELRVSARGAPLLDEQGAIRGIVVVVRDITEQRMTEQQLVLSQKMESLGRLASGVAHDFNNLLATIQGLGDLILEDMSEKDPLYDDLKEIVGASRRAADLTRQLLVFSRRGAIEIRTVDVSDIINGMEKMVRRIIGEDIRFATTLSPETCSVRADPAQLEQVLMNLVVNARDAMPGGGELKVSTSIVSTSAESSAAARLEGKSTMVRISVQDSGSGMDEATKARIFEPFFTTKSIERGTGIGLSTVYGIVRQLGGSIQVDTATGKGSTFQVDIPLTDVSEEPDSSDPMLDATLSQARETVLVVEDDPMLRRLVARILRKRGYNVLVAADGVEALALFDRHPEPIHLLVSDVVMPGLGGVQLADELLMRHPELKVLFMSGYTDDAVVQRGLASDSPGFLAKPFSAVALTNKVQEVLHGPQDAAPPSRRMRRNG